MRLAARNAFLVKTRSFDLMLAIAEREDRTGMRFHTPVSPRRVKKGTPMIGPMRKPARSRRKVRRVSEGSPMFHYLQWTMTETPLDATPRKVARHAERSRITTGYVDPGTVNKRRARTDKSRESARKARNVRVARQRMRQKSYAEIAANPIGGFIGNVQ